MPFTASACTADGCTTTYKTCRSGHHTGPGAVPTTTCMRRFTMVPQKICTHFACPGSSVTFLSYTLQWHSYTTSMHTPPLHRLYLGHFSLHLHTSLQVLFYISHSFVWNTISQCRLQTLCHLTHLHHFCMFHIWDTTHYCSVSAFHHLDTSRTHKFSAASLITGTTCPLHYHRAHTPHTCWRTTFWFPQDHHTAWDFSTVETSRCIGTGRTAHLR